jgi:hypothetical protein
MCQATNIGGMTRDISSLVVQEDPTPSEWPVLEQSSYAKSCKSFLLR